MILLPTFGFKGTVLPFIDKTDKLYLLIENDTEYRILLNVVSSTINKFVNVNPKSTKIIYSGYYISGLHLKVFYSGQELFDFNYNEFTKQSLSLYSDFIIKNVLVVDDISFSPSFTDGLKITPISNKPQNLFIQILDNDKNEILHEDSFISSEPYVFKQNNFINYGILIYNVYGEKIYNYNLDLKNKKVWIKLEKHSIGDSIALIPYIEEFRKKHQCEIFCATRWNSLFIVEYPNINFTNFDEESLVLKNFFAIYKLKNNIGDKIENVVCKSLGLEYKEIKLNDVLEHMKEISRLNNI